MCANIFFRAKTRFHLRQKRAIFVGFLIEFSAPHQPLMSTLAPLKSSFYTLSNGAKLDISRARGAFVQTFFFSENSRKIAKIARYEQKMYEQNLTIGAHLIILFMGHPRELQETRRADLLSGTSNSKIHYVTTPCCIWSVSRCVCTICF